LKPLANAAHLFPTLFLYQLFEELVRFAHPRLGDTFPDSLILQLTGFLENSILMREDEPPKNPYSILGKSISISIFDDIITRFSPALIQLYLECSGYASGTSLHQIRQLEAGATIDPNVDMTSDESFHGLMTVRDLRHTQEILCIVYAITCHVCRVCSDIHFRRFEARVVGMAA
jgi:hypothetical protein